MMKAALPCLLLSFCLAGTPRAQEEKTAWKPVERTEYYAVSGSSGPELYASIGDRGPKIAGAVSTIAHTSFKLTWRRNYVPKDGGCVLASAQPRLIITYVLPRVRGKLPPAVRSEWDRFSEGVQAHEKVHGQMIVDMVREIEAVSVGLSVPDDPECKAIRTELTRRLAEISQRQRARSRDFDRMEMSDGGNIHSLILRLVNGS
jgi:predicted secreted Zn-dependent protease